MKAQPGKGLSLLLALMMVLSVFAGLPGISYATGDENATQAAEQETKAVNDADKSSDESVSTHDAGTAGVKASEDNATSCTAEGDGSQNNPYVISTSAQMVDLQKQVASGTTFAGKCFKLKNDITIADDEDFTGIGTSSKKFSGKFDGNNKKITVTIARQSMSNVGIFGYVSGDSVIENLTVAGKIAAAYNVGGIVGYNAGATIRNCVNEAEIMTDAPTSYGTFGAGGIAGVMVNSDKTSVHAIENCVNKGEIKAGYTSTTGSSKINFGGIVGAVYNSSRNITVSVCRNEGSINEVPATAGVGGIAGYICTSEVTMEDCSNSGDISATGTAMYGNNGVGGIIGFYSGHSASDAENTVTRCENTGAITGRDASYASTGGIIGQDASSVSVEQCVNKGDVTGKDAYAGGIVGDSAGTIAECYNGGAVSNIKASPTSSYVAAAGGITGYNESTAKLYKSYSYGKVACTATSNVYVGGVIGRTTTTSIDSDKIYSNRYLEDSADTGIGQTTTDNEACTSFEKSKANDILDTIGKAYQADLQTPINNGYPILRWQNTAATYSLDFKVTDKETKAVLKDAKITVEGQAATEDGSFELAPGTYSYKVARDGYTDVTGSVTLKKKSVDVAVELTSVKHEYTVKITPADAIVKIANENGAPDVADPEVTKDETADEAAYVYTLADKAAYGEYKLSLSKYLYTAQNVSLEATGKDDTKAIKMEKAKTESLTIKVKPADAKVYLTNSDFDAQAEAKSADNGTWVYDVVPGEYTYKVKAANHSTKTGKLTVSDDKEITVELEEKAVWDGTTDTDWYKWHPFTKTYEISEPEELAGLAELVNDGKDFSGKTVVLTRDIDLGGNEETKTNSWVSIGNNKMTFNGTFKGNGHKIKNLYIDMTGSSSAAFGYRGLFGQTNGADISGLTFENLNITTATTTGYQNVGAVTGFGTKTTISDITVNGKITIPSSGAYTGGITGKFDGTISDCVNNADITSGYQVGGIIGTTYTNNGTKILRCVNNGTVTGNKEDSYSVKSYGAGGIAGYLYKTNDEVKYCVNHGTVTGKTWSLGGLVGANSTSSSYKTQIIDSSYNTGAVKSTAATDAYVGGIIGYATIATTPNIMNCYNAGEISGSTYLGGIIGTQSTSTVNGSQMYNNYYPANDKYTGSRTTSATIKNEAFAEFDKVADNDYSALIEKLGPAYRADIKDGDEYKYNNGYPVLRWQDPNSTYQVKFEISYSSRDNITEENPAKIVVKNNEGKEMTGDGVYYELASGSYTYTVSRKGYDTVSGNLKVKGDSLTEAVKLTAEKYSYVITVDKKVGLTVRKVTADGKVAIENPAYEEGENGAAGTYTYKLTNSTYEYEAKRLGYEKETGEFRISYEGGSKEIDLKAIKTAKVSFSVKAESGSFAGTDPVVSIYSKGGDFDGTLMGTYDNTSKLSEGLQFPAGDYTYKIKAEGFSTVSGSFTAEAGKPVEVSEILKVKTGWGGAEDIDTDWYTDDTSASTYTLKNEAQLAGLAKLVNNQTSTFSGKTVLLARDMNLEDNAWTPIGGYANGVVKAFSGTFDGQGHRIILKNGEVKASESSFGVFGCLRNANVKNLTLQGRARVDYTNRSATFALLYAGGLAGYAANSKIEKCSNQLTMDMSLTNEAGTASVNAGGLVGWSVGTSYDSCNNIAPLKVDVTGKGNTVAYVGGIAGFQNCGTTSTKATVEECYNTGDVAASAVNSSGGSSTCYAGGIFGNLNGSYLDMIDCYNAGSAKAEGSAAKTGALAAYATGTTSSSSLYFNNYYLDNGLSDPTPDSEKRTDSQMRLIDFVRELGDGYALNNNGGYPILAWEKPVDHIKVSTLPDKTEYNDLSDFDDTGMKLTVCMNKDDSDATEITSGWTVKNGKKLKASQKSVTIEYKGAEVELPITVNQVTHDIKSEELAFDITAPEAGQTPQKEIKLTDEQSEKYSADFKWTKAGKEVKGDFEKASYYRAHVTLTSRYAKGDVYYVFERGAYPEADSAYEIKNYRQTVNADKERTVTEFDLTFRATTNASKDNDDNISHLYYEGDKESSADYGSLLDNELTVKIGDKTKKFTVREIEQKVLEDGIGVQAEYAGREYAGIKLYDLLLESGLSQNAADDTVIMLTGKNENEKTKLTIGDLRKQDSEEGAIIAYGDADRGTPLGKSKGPLQMIQKDAKAKTRANLSEISIGDAEDVAVYKTTFKVNQEDPEITVKDSYGNEMKADSDNALSYTLRDGESYSYRVTKKDFTVQKGKITVEGKDQTIEIELDSVWDGKTLTEPKKDENGYYLIGTGAELMWWHENYDQTDKVKLTADIALNDGESKANNWEVLGSTSEYGSTGTVSFQGTFDGQGHVIRNMSISRENTYELELSWDGSVMAFPDRVGQIGMFGYISGSAEIKDLGIEGDIYVFDRPDSMYADWMQVGGIAGFAQGNAKISGCYTNMGIRAIASLETETVGGYPLGGYGYACDTYIGGIAGSLSGNATITECYSKGTYIGAETRQVTAGGIVGAMRYSPNSVTDCYSTASIDARPLSSTQWTSYLGGIAGNAAKDKNEAALKNSFALNGYIKGNDNKTEAGKVAGNANADTFTGNYGLEDIKTTGAKLNSQFDGEKLTAEQAVKAGTYSSWNKDSWKLADGAYPQLAWQTRAAGADKSASYTGQKVNEDAEWDGYFSEQTPPPYFNLYVQVKGHTKVLAKKFTKKDMLAMAESDNQGTLYYSAIGNGYAGRAVKEYVYLDTLFGKAGVEFASGDSLTFGSYIYDHDGLMADRYYYPEWTSGSDKDAVKVKPVLALKSFGASSGVSKDYWNYYASQADYLYAYMINYGQKTPDDFTYSYFTYQQTEGTVNYKTDSAANETVKKLLSEAIGEAQLDADATYISEDGTDVSSAYSYTDKAAKDRFGKAIDEARAVLEKEGVTNGDIMGAYDDLADAQQRFDKLKKQGKGADRTGLESAIAIAENMLDDVTVSKDGKNVSENEVWATQRTVGTLKDAIKAAKSVASDRNASQAEIDAAETAMKDALSDFITSDGQLEPLARAAAIEELKDYTESLGLDSYREAERAQIADLLKEYKEKIENAENAGKITELLTEAKAAIGAVKNEDQAVKSEAKGELAGYKDLSKLDREDRVLIREIISEYSDKIDEAKTQEEIDKLVKEAKAEIDLAIAKAEATYSLEDWYGKTDLYYEAEQNKIVKIVLVNVKAIKDAESIKAVEKIVADANAAIARLKTKAVIDNTPAKTAGVKAASASYKSVKISWKKDKKAKSYEVYRATSKNGKYTKVKTMTATSYTNGKLTAGKTYYYKVSAYGTLDGKKLYGGYSSAVKARPVPAKVKASVKAIGTWRITVKWKKVTGASGYQIYRATTKNGKYKKLTTVKGGSKTSYTNKRMYKNQRYYYKVRAYRTVKGKAVYGSFSAVKSAKVK